MSKAIKVAKIYCVRHVPQDDAYLRYVTPLAYLKLTCRHSSCSKRAVLWLNATELEAYEQGRRLFWSADEAIKIDDSDPKLRPSRIVKVFDFFRP